MIDQAVAVQVWPRLCCLIRYFNILYGLPPKDADVMSIHKKNTNLDLFPSLSFFENQLVSKSDFECRVTDCHFLAIRNKIPHP